MLINLISSSDLINDLVEMTIGVIAKYISENLINSIDLNTFFPSISLQSYNVKLNF